LPLSWLHVRARLAPVAGTKAVGRFEGVLVKRGERSTSAGKVANPRGNAWRLTWQLSLPALDGPVTASLRIDSGRSSAHVRRVLCARCSTSTAGTMTLTARQVMRIRKSNAVVVVRTSSARLRGPVRVFVHVPVHAR
jgi:hypothetical protein